MSHLLKSVAVQETDKVFISWNPKLIFQVRLHYDPQIAKAFSPKDGQEVVYNDLDLFPVIWDKIPLDLPIMLVRGETSDLLLPETVQKMQVGREKNFKFLEIEGVGHAPMFISRLEVESIAEFLNTEFQK